jgi:hypothetical protein
MVRELRNSGLSKPAGWRAMKDQPSARENAPPT